MYKGPAVGRSVAWNGGTGSKMPRLDRSEKSGGPPEMRVGGRRVRWRRLSQRLQKSGRKSR